MKLTRAEFNQVMLQVIASKEIVGVKKKILLAFAERPESIIPAHTIAKTIGSTTGSVRALIVELRRRIDGTGLKMTTFLGKGGGVMLEYAPGFEADE